MDTYCTPTEFIMIDDWMFSLYTMPEIENIETFKITLWMKPERSLVVINATTPEGVSKEFSSRDILDGNVNPEIKLTDKFFNIVRHIDDGAYGTTLKKILDTPESEDIIRTTLDNLRNSSREYIESFNGVYPDNYVLSEK